MSEHHMTLLTNHAISKITNIVLNIHKKNVFYNKNIANECKKWIQYRFHYWSYYKYMIQTVPDYCIMSDNVAITIINKVNKLEKERQKRAWNAYHLRIALKKKSYIPNDIINLMSIFIYNE